MATSIFPVTLAASAVPDAVLEQMRSKLAQAKLKQAELMVKLNKPTAYKSHPTAGLKRPSPEAQMACPPKAKALVVNLRGSIGGWGCAVLRIFVGCVCL